MFEMPVVDNQFVHKGDLLMVIDPTDYRIALNSADAAVLQAKATAENALAQAERRRKLSDLAETIEDREIHESNALATQCTISAGHRATRSGEGQSRTHPDPFSREWMGDQSVGAAG